MSDSMSRLDERFAALAAEVTRVAHPVPANQLRAAGERRRTLTALTVLAAGLATSGLIIGVVGLASTNPQQRSVGDPSRPPLMTAIPTALRMPHEGEPGWSRDDDPEIASAFNPCSAADLTRVERTDAATMTGPGNPIEEEHSPTRITHHLFRYRSDTAADTVLKALDDAVARCGWTGGLVSQTVYGRQTLIAAAWPFASVSPTPPDAAIHDGLVTRRGNALIIRYAAVGGHLCPVWTMMRWSFCQTKSAARWGCVRRRYAI